MEQKGTTQVQVRRQSFQASARDDLLLQRQCACGQHTLAGGECEACSKNHDSLGQRAGVAPLSPSLLPSSTTEPPQTGFPESPAADSWTAESSFAHDFSQVPIHVASPAGGQAASERASTAPFFPSPLSAAGRAPALQAKYEAPQPTDVYEREADEIAERAAQAEQQSDSTAPVEKTPLPQPSPSSNVILNILKQGPAMPLSSAVRRRVEPLFGVDLSSVRVHTGPTASEATSILHAKAFTSQDHIWLGARQSPESVELMAHEATHVVQQAAHPNSTPQRAVQRKQDDAEHVEDGEEVKQKMKRRIRQALEQADQQSPDKPQPDPARTAEIVNNQQPVADPATQKATRALDPAALEEKSAELQPDAKPPVDRQAEVQPKVEQAAQQVKEKSDRPPEPQPAQTKLPQTTHHGKGTAPGRSVVDEAVKAAQQADSAITGTQVPELPTPLVADTSALTAPPTPVDAKGEPVPTDPEVDAQAIDLAQQAQTLRVEGQQLRAVAAQEKGNAHILRSNMVLIQKNIGQAEEGVATSVDHLSFRRDTLDKARDALKLSDQKTEMVAKEAPGYVSRADEVQQRSGPMARDATKLSTENKSKSSDDPKGSAKSREQGEKLGKVGSDTVTVNEAVTQTRERAGALSEDAAKASQMNTSTRTKVETMQDTLQKSDDRLSQMKEQNKQARSEMEEVKGQPETMAAEAVSLDKQGESLIQAASAIEQQLQQSQMNYMQSMQRVPGAEEPQGVEAVSPDQAQAPPASPADQSMAEPPTALTSPSSETTPQETSTASSSETGSMSISQDQTALSQQPAGNQNTSQVQPGAGSSSSGQPEAMVSQVPEQTVPPVQEGQTQPMQTAPGDQQSPAPADYSQRIQVDLAGSLPSLLTGEERPSEQESEKAKQENEKERKDDVALVKALAGKKFEELSAGRKVGIAIQLTGHKLFRSISKTQWPGWGKLAKGLIDPRGPLTGVLGGLSMMLAAGANLFSKEQWERDPIGNALKSAADIATGLTIIFGSITALAGLIIAIATAATILSFGLAAPITGPIIAFCATVLTTVGGWTIFTGLIALGLQAMVLIKNLIEAATAKNATELEASANNMKDDVSNAGNVLMQMGMAKLGQIGGRALSTEIREAGGAVRFAAIKGAKGLPSRIRVGVKAAGGFKAYGRQLLGSVSEAGGGLADRVKAAGGIGSFSRQVGAQAVTRVKSGLGKAWKELRAETPEYMRGRQGLSRDFLIGKDIPEGSGFRGMTQAARTARAEAQEEIAAARTARTAGAAAERLPARPPVPGEPVKPPTTEGGGPPRESYYYGGGEAGSEGMRPLPPSPIAEKAPGLKVPAEAAAVPEQKVVTGITSGRATQQSGVFERLIDKYEDVIKANPHLNDRLYKIQEALKKGSDAADLLAKFERDAERLKGFEPPGSHLEETALIEPDDLERLSNVHESDIARFHWKVTEEDLNLLKARFPDLPPEGWRTGRAAAFAERKELPRGRFPERNPDLPNRPSYTQPDAYHPGTDTHPPVSFEAKNWKLGNRDDFVYSTARQAVDRAEHLPGKAQQWLVIDLRGQAVSAAEWERIVADLERLSKNVLNRDRIIPIR